MCMLDMSHARYMHDIDVLLYDTGPQPRWLIGNMASLAGGKPMHVTFSKWNIQYGPLYKVGA